MARALIVGCGCRARALGERLSEQGWQVRGTTRRPENAESIEAAGFEAVIADPDRAGTVIEHLGEVTIAVYLMGTAVGEPEALAAIHGPRLERILEKLVDSPVRGFVYEAAGSIQPTCFETGERLVSEAAERWRIPVALITADPADHESWLADGFEAVTRLTAGAEA